jgi:hypothetical protein
VAKAMNLPAILTWRRIGASLDPGPGPQRILIDGTTIETMSSRNHELVFSVGRAEPDRGVGGED